MDKQRHTVSKYKKNVSKRFDIILFFTVIAISFFGIVMVFDSSINFSNDKFHYVLLQSLWVTIGIIGMLIISKYDYRKIAKLSFPLLLILIISLIVTLVLGNKINGAVRWINIGPFQFQPSEMIKPVLVLYLASWFAKARESNFTSFKEKLKHNFYNEFMPFISILGLITILVIVGRDLGTAIIISSIAIGMYFIQATEFVSLLNLVFIFIIFLIGGIVSIFTQSYRLNRLFDKNPLEGGYQIKQILIAIGSGGIWGRGFTQSIQKQRYLVESTAATDSIYAVIAEEFGLIGSGLLFSAYILLTYRFTKIAINSKDNLGKYITMGICIWIVVQTLLNIAVNVSLVPLTGVPLPLISYGGSSTMSTLFAIGIVLNISRHNS